VVYVGKPQGTENMEETLKIGDCKNCDGKEGRDYVCGKNGFECPVVEGWEETGFGSGD